MQRRSRAGPSETAERRAILLLAGCASRRAARADAARALLGLSTEDRLILLLDRLRLTGLVGQRILDLAGTDAFPSLKRRTQASILATRRRGEVQAVVQREILRRLTRHGIAAIALKGPDLALRVHGDLGSRPCVDVDVVVDPSRLKEAVAIVETLGYCHALQAPWFEELHDRLDHPAGTMPVVEVHWRAEWYSRTAGNGGFARGALERSIPDPAGRGRSVAPADELAMLLLVYARDSMAGLRLPADLAAWWDRYGSTVPPGALQAIVDADPPLAVPLATAALVCERLVGLPADELLGLGPARTRRGRLAARLADPFLDEAPAHRASSVIDGLFSSRQTLRPFLRRRVLLPVGHVGLRYGAGGHSSASLHMRGLQIQHPFRQLAHYARFVANPPPPPPHIDWDS